jgi:hypothetical protein
MNTPNEDPKPVDNMELLKQQASACGAGCACHGTGSSGGIRGVLGIIVLLVAVTLVARAVVKNHGTSTEPAAPGFATLAPTTTADGQAPVNPVEAVAATEASVGTNIASLSDLNQVAAANDAVFVYVPAKDEASTNTPAASMKSAASRINSQGHKVALFTLETGSRDYAQLTAQMSVPAVLALVKGRGMSAVSGEITETKLIQGFVAAANAGGCGPGGCGPAGCCPPTGSK